MKANYVKTQLKTVVNISKIVTVHYYEFDKSFVFNGEAHDFWEMVYIDKGRVEIRRDGEPLDLSQGEIVFHNPNEFHSIKALNSEPNFFVISFVCNSPLMNQLEGYYTTVDKTLKGFISSIIKEAESAYKIPKNDPSLKKLIKKPSASVGAEQLIKTYLEQFLILLIRNMLEQDKVSLFPSKESMETHLVSCVKEWVRDRAEQSFRIEELCRTLGYSRSYLSKLFHEQTGETIIGYAVREKIRRAKELIREGRFNFTEISDRLSFDNPQYFSRVFRRVTGMTPTEFKHSLRFEE